MKTPQLDTVYKSYTDAYHAAETLRKRDTGADTMVRIERAPLGRGYVIRSTPVRVEMFFLKSSLRFGMKLPGAFSRHFNPAHSRFGG